MPTDVLIVDDEASMRGLLTQVLEEDGFVVSEAASGEEALEIFSRSAPPIVFADIRMEGMSGLQLLEEIKKARPETEVIIITSHASLDSALIALRAGAYDFLVKPFEDLSLISAAARRVSDKIGLLKQNRTLVDELKEKNQELEQSNQVLAELANKDGLSGLFNHRYFQEILEKELTRAKRYERNLALLFLDIDHFKTYNDTNGHPAGDFVIQTIGKLLVANLRSTDIVSRYGGEEFTIILPETDRKGAVNIAETLRRRVAEFPFPGRESQPKGFLSISTGVAVFPDDGTSREEIVSHADEALYNAKKGGRNIVC